MKEKIYDLSQDSWLSIFNTNDINKEKSDVSIEESDTENTIFTSPSDDKHNTNNIKTDIVVDNT